MPLNIQYTVDSEFYSQKSSSSLATDDRLHHGYRGHKFRFLLQVRAITNRFTWQRAALLVKH